MPILSSFGLRSLIKWRGLSFLFLAYFIFCQEKEVFCASNYYEAKDGSIVSAIKELTVFKSENVTDIKPCAGDGSACGSSEKKIAVSKCKLVLSNGRTIGLGNLPLHDSSVYRLSDEDGAGLVFLSKRESAEKHLQTMPLFVYDSKSQVIFFANPSSQGIEGLAFVLKDAKADEWTVYPSEDAARKIQDGSYDVLKEMLSGRRMISGGKSESLKLVRRPLPETLSSDEEKEVFFKKSSHPPTRGSIKWRTSPRKACRVNTFAFTIEEPTVYVGVVKSFDSGNGKISIITWEGEFEFSIKQVADERNPATQLHITQAVEAHWPVTYTSIERLEKIDTGQCVEVLASAVTGEAGWIRMFNGSGS